MSPRPCAHVAIGASTGITWRPALICPNPLGASRIRCTGCDATARNSGSVVAVWRPIIAAAVCVAGCRSGFERNAPEADPAIGPLTCGSSRVVGSLSAVPLGLGLAATKDGAIVAWTAGAAGTTLFTTRLAIDGDEIISADATPTTLPQPIGDFGLVGDGDARYLLSAQLPAGALFVPVDSALKAGGASMVPGASITHHAVAEPITAGSAFAAIWIESGQARLSQLDATGAPTGMVHARPAVRDAAVRRGAQRHIIAWTPAVAGCDVWAFDARFTPLLPDPLLHMPGDECLRSAITRHDVGTNLLAWLAGGGAHAQLGTDTDVVGAELAIGASADDLEIATAGAGFFVAVSSGDAILPGYVRTDATGWTTLSPVPHVRGSPLRLIPYLRDALLVSVGDPASEPQLRLTRLCEPGA